MAKITRQDDKLVVTLSGIEKVESIRGGFEIPLQTVRKVEVVEKPIKEVHGLRPSRAKLFGTYMPGETAVGTFLRNGLRRKLIFVAVHHSDKLGVRILLEGASYSELLIGCDNPEGIVGLLG